MYQWQGLGQSGQQVVGTLASAGAPVATAAIAGTSLAVPLIGAAIAGVTIAIEAILNSGCGQTCIETSQWANAAEQQLQANIAAYFALPTPRSETNQAAALANFDSIWAGLEARCGAAGTGTAGQKCISDRQAGACTWKQTADKVPSWGTPAAGECWNWFSGYRDPIANDPNVAPDSLAASASSAVTALTGGSGLVELALAAVAVFVLYKML
jgi:hypothetical protein